MLVAAAVCPHPPLLVPEVAGAAAPELDGVRDACDVAVRRLLGARVHLVVVVGVGPGAGVYDASAGGSLAGYGSDIHVGQGEAVLPLSLTVGRWLLDRTAGREVAGVGADGPGLLLHSVGARTAPAQCLALGAALGTRAMRVGMLVMGDGSARRGTESGTEVGERARLFDADAIKALAAADAGALAGLDADLADELAVAGRAPWQVLAGAADRVSFEAELLADATPYGVAYVVASWATVTPDASETPGAELDQPHPGVGAAVEQGLL